MLNFDHYRDLVSQIHTPETLKARVEEATRNALPDPVVSKPTTWRFAQKAVIAALLALCIPISAFAASRYLGMTDYLGLIDWADLRTVEEMTTIFPTDASATPVNDKIQAPEFRALEVLCDTYNLYLIAEIVPKDDRYLLVPRELDVEEDVEKMHIPGVSGMTIKEYAQSLGKEPLWVTVQPEYKHNSTYFPSAQSLCSADGRVTQYFIGSNPSEKSEFSLTLRCDYMTLDHYMTRDQLVRERFCFDIPIQNNCTIRPVAVLTEFEDTGPGLTPISLTIEESELAMYGLFTYRTEDTYEYTIDIYDQNGHFLGIPGGPRLVCVDNGDGTYSHRVDFAKVDSLEGLQYYVLRYPDFKRFGPFKILG